MPRKIKSFNYDDTFPRRFRELLDSREDITQEAIAELVGVTRQTVGNWYSGKSAPDAVSLTKIADEFDVSIDWLLRENAPKQIDATLSSVCRYTGLSESAIKHLAFWQKQLTSESDMDSVFAILDMIIDSGEDEDLLFWLSEYRDALRVVKALKDSKYNVDELVNLVNDETKPYGVRVQARYMIALLDAHLEGLASRQEMDGKFSITTDEFRVSLVDVYESKAQHEFGTLLNKIRDSILGDPVIRAIQDIEETMKRVDVIKKNRKEGALNGKHPETNE